MEEEPQGDALIEEIEKEEVIYKAVIQRGFIFSIIKYLHLLQPVFVLLILY